MRSLKGSNCRGLFCGALCVALFFNATLAWSASEQELALALIKRAGIEAFMVQQKQQDVLRAQARADQLTLQMQKLMKPLPEHFLVQADVLLEQLVVSIDKAWDVDQAMAVYASAWVDHYSRPALRQMLEDYPPPNNLKVERVTAEAAERLESYIKQEQKRRIENEFNRFLQDFKAAALSAKNEHKSVLDKGH